MTLYCCSRAYLCGHGHLPITLAESLGLHDYWQFTPRAFPPRIFDPCNHLEVGRSEGADPNVAAVSFAVGPIRLARSHCFAFRDASSLKLAACRVEQIVHPKRQRERRK